MSPKHLGRTAACTAVALAAGALLSAPAVAAERAGDRPQRTVLPATPPGWEQPVDRPVRAAQAGEARSGAVAAAARAVAPRFDPNGDGFPDVLYRAVDGKYYDAPGGNSRHTAYGVGIGLREDFAYKDVIPVGRLDGDSRTDLLTLTADGALQLFPGASKSATRTSATWTGRGWQTYNKVFSPGDLTKDGKADLLARTYNGALYLYPSTGEARTPYKDRVLVGAGWGAFDQLVGVNDVTGDGIADVVARTAGGDLYTYPGTGRKSEPFGARKKAGHGYQIYNQLVGVDDRDGDGVGDLVGRTTGGSTYLYRGDGKGGFRARETTGSGWYLARVFGAQGGMADTGRNDLLARDSAGTLWWYYGANNGLLGPRKQLSDRGGWKGATLTYVSSLDGDNDADILELWNNHLYIEGRDIGSGWAAYNAILGAGDLNGDGRADLLARDKAGGAMYLYRGNGKGGVSARLKVGSGWGGFTKLTGAGDLTGDGRADLVARDRSGNLYLYAGTGSASAPFKGKVRIGTGYNAYRHLVVTGDLTGDGRADLVATDSSGNLWRYASYGNGKLTARAKIGTGYGIYPNLY
ncbi:FG-GAP-like repeat-containing protein [Streptomyces sp. NPDC097619]|uniref:FG-GAP repeat domain-containing protein n=1 Tax=Streptomyces sp. NPDC097619 TaxID=3157228 RepID=UPI003324AD65